MPPVGERQLGDLVAQRADHHVLVAQLQRQLAHVGALRNELRVQGLRRKRKENTMCPRLLLHVRKSV